MQFDSTFSARVNAFGKRVASLRDEVEGRSKETPSTQELLEALEELHSAEEELRAQQDELLLVQAQLDEERARYRDLFENAPDAYFVTDPRGMIQDVNRAGGRLLAISQRYLAGKPLLHYFQSMDVREVRQQMRDLEHTFAPREFMARFSPRGGPLIHVSVTLTAITQAAEVGERCVGIRWLVRDASARMKAEMEVKTLREDLARIEAERFANVPEDVREAMNLVARERAAREQAEQGSRMKDQFLAQVVHELRNPVTPVLTALEELLEDKERHPPAMREMLEMMHRNLVSQSRMIGDLLDVARVIHGKLQLKREAVDIAEPLKEAISGLSEAAAAKRQHLRTEMPRELIAVHGDAVRLRQVFWNLISNAIKFTPAGGEIGVRLFADQRQVYVEVRDTGVGIRPESLGTIFDAFEQTSSQFARSLGGLGLGLSIVRSLVEAHGGHVDAESKGEGSGALFRVRLPRSTAVPRPRVPVVSSKGQPTRPMKILIVEDHADTRKALANLLSKMGHHVRTAGSVEEAVREAERGRFDLTISDLSLPDGNGRDFLSRAPRDHVGMAVACSGWGMPEDYERSKKAGFSLHLTKPVSIEQLRQILQRFSDGGLAGS